jgi:hypothetical protein
LCGHLHFFNFIFEDVLIIFLRLSSLLFIFEVVFFEEVFIFFEVVFIFFLRSFSFFCLSCWLEVCAMLCCWLKIIRIRSSFIFKKVEVVFYFQKNWSCLPFFQNEVIFHFQKLRSSFILKYLWSSSIVKKLRMSSFSLN